MPKVPEVGLKVNVAFPRENSGYADPRAMSYIAGKAGDAADAVTKLGNQVMDIVNENQRKKDNLEALKLSAQMQENYTREYQQLELNTTDPTDFEQKALQLHDDMSNSIMEQASNKNVRDVLEQQFVRTRLDASNQAINFGIQLGQVKALNDLDTALNTAANTVRRDPSQYDAQKAFIGTVFENAKGLLKPDAELNYQQKAQQDLAESQLLGVAEKDAWQADKLLKSGKFDSVLSADRSVQLANTIESEQKKQQSAFEADMMVGVSRGQVSQSQLNAARAAKRIDDHVWAALTMKRDDVVLSAKQDGDSVNSVRDALLGKGAIDPNDAKAKKAADRVFSGAIMPKVDQLLQSGDSVSRDTANSLVADFVAKTGHIPQPVKSQLYAAARGGSEEDLAHAADLFQRLEKANPQAVGDMQQKDIETLRMTATLIDSGLTGQQAAARAKELSNPVDVATRQLREERLKDKEDEAGKMMQGITASSLVQDAFTPSKGSRLINSVTMGYAGSSKPVLPEQSGALAAANRDAQSLFKYWYLKTGDAEVAKKQATRDIQRSWTVSQVGGKPTLMKYAPESMYSIPGRDSTWIKQQVLDSVHEIVGNKSVKPEDIVIVSDNHTEREATSGYAPSYGVLIRDKDGVLVPVQKEIDGRLVQGRFAPDQRSEIDKMKGEEALKNELEVVTGRMARMLATKRQWIDDGGGDQKLWFNNPQDEQTFNELRARARELNLKVPQSDFHRAVTKAVYETDAALKSFADKPLGDKFKSVLINLAKGAAAIQN